MNIGRLVFTGVLVGFAMARGLRAEDSRQAAPKESPLEYQMRVNPVGLYDDAEKQAFETHPDLEEEYKEIYLEKDSQEDEVQAEMIKVDPSLEPILERIGLNRKIATAERLGTPPPVDEGVPPFPPGFTFTPELSAKLLKARNTAMRNHPDLLTAATENSKRAVAFYRQLDAVILEVHPEYAPMIANMRKPNDPRAHPASGGQNGSSAK